MDITNFISDSPLPLTRILKKYAQINPSKKFLSDPMLHYILKNCAPKIYFKLIKSAKYFFVNKPPLLVNLRKKNERTDLANHTSWRHQNYNIDLTNEIFWLEGHLFCSNQCFSASNLLTKVYRCDLFLLMLENQNLTYKELQFLMGSGTIGNLSLHNNTFLHSDRKKVDIEEILMMTPKLENLK